MTVRVLEPGLFTTVQDLGRPGRGSSGVPRSGAMDPLSLRAANLLVGNRANAAALEITMSGPLLAFDDETMVAVAGAHFEVELDGASMEPNASIRAAAGTTLRVGRAQKGLRAYLAFGGGVDVPVVLGSRSTLVPAGLGGRNGRALAARDVLRVGAAPATADPRPRRLGPHALPHMTEGPIDLRAIAGPQEDAFSADARAVFWTAGFRVSSRSDRAGVRLEGTPIEHRGDADVDPEGLLVGAVQVPMGGDPIVIGPDGPTTGGYAKIATVITADLPLIAQARPGDTLRFAAMTVEEARAAWHARERALSGGIEQP